jgi:hypothetical protein
MLDEIIIDGLGESIVVLVGVYAGMHEGGVEMGHCFWLSVVLVLK